LSSPRLKRLERDFAAVTDRFSDHSFITVQAIGPAPASKYRLIYKVPSLRIDGANRVTVSELTVVELTLPMDYPKAKPSAVAMERVFHPNFADYVCIADFWSPAQKLEDIIIEIGEMLQWQKYNIRSPLDAVAAQWATKNMDELPIGKIKL
jgi:ubiquitin-protein ligase